MLWTVVLIILGSVVMAALGTLACNVALNLWRKTQEARADVEALRLQAERQRLDLDRGRLQITQQVWPDEQGQYPMLWDGQNLLDPNRGAVFRTDEGATAVTPALAIPEQKARILRAAGGWPQVASDKAAQLLAQPGVAIHWPSRVPLGGVLEGPSSFRSLVLGVTVKPDGSREVVRGDMGQMVHVAVGGSSGWGKSVFLRSLAFQLAQSADLVDLALVDLEGATFAPFAACEWLLWPVADNEDDALAILSELTAELDRRKTLFADQPGVDSLSAYNAQADESLAPCVCLVDEATALLGDKDVENALRTLALRARKYGLWLILGGQDWKATSLDTAIRNQLATRVQFKAMSPSQSRVLLQQAGAEDLDAKERALAWLPGQELTEMQIPWVSRQDIIDAMTGKGPRRPMPETTQTRTGQRRKAVDADTVARILKMHATGESDTAVARTVFGYGNPFYIEKVRAVLQQQKEQQHASSVAVLCAPSARRAACVQIVGGADPSI